MKKVTKIVLTIVVVGSLLVGTLVFLSTLHRGLATDTQTQLAHVDPPSH